MKKGSTPTHIFALPISGEAIKNIEITYSQDRAVVLQKYKPDCTIDKNKVSLTLSQEDTFLFKDDVNVEIQIRVMDIDDHVYPSNIMRVSCDRCLSKAVME